MEQGRIAAAKAFGVNLHSDPAHYPYGIYTIPEISFIGKTEEQLTDAGMVSDAGAPTVSGLEFSVNRGAASAAAIWMPEVEVRLARGPSKKNSPCLRPATCDPGAAPGYG